MLISRVSEIDTQEEWQPLDEGEVGRGVDRGHSHEYQTANELFEIMAKNHTFDSSVKNSLSTSDLVILYRNIEVGTKLITDAEESKRKPNQYIETIVYNDESDGSDCCESYSEHEWKDVVLINKERIDLLSSPPSLENTLSPKYGNLEIPNSHLSTQYNNHFLFKDPYIKEQLESMKVANFNSHDFESTMFPASLLDYICCKRLEDNYNFYMDNVIRYVKHSIDQLKRISNGDYLTEKVKEKWREVESASTGDMNDTKVLATSASIPLQVLRRKVIDRSRTWEDIIHSEVDVRSLSKILEKKIIVEVPKLICGSYNFFSKLCSDNLIVSCEREGAQLIKSKNKNKTKESRLDVILQLNRSGSAQVMSNISSIMILQPITPIQHDESTSASLIQLPCPEISDVVDDKKIIEMIEVEDDKNCSQGEEKEPENINVETHTSFSIDQDDDYIDMTDSNNNSFFESGDSSVALKDVLDTSAVSNIIRKEAPFNFILPDDLTLSMHKMNMSCVPEENVEESVPFPIDRKKSNTKMRVKSPYENKSHHIEEKKRKRLLEIRERREKKKIAMSDNSKINKHKYGKGAIMPQPSSSVTKLSITNKSFYNSIYGQNTNTIDKPMIKSWPRKGKRDLVIDTRMDEHESVVSTPDKNSKKFINRSYYLDDAVTEMMYTQQSDCSSDVREIFSASTSLVSNDMGSNLTKLVNEPSTNVKIKSSCEKFEQFNCVELNIGTEDCRTRISCSRSVLNVVPKNSSKEFTKEDIKKSTTVECRKSIDKLYDLMKNMGKIQINESKLSKSKLTANIVQENSTLPCSDSDTSLKHHLTSSNPSSFSFEKMQIVEDVLSLKNTIHRKNAPLMTVAPKVIISAKQEVGKAEINKNKRERKKVLLNPPLKVSDNPLKAISQFLHEFDNVQKAKQTKQNDSKSSKKVEVSFDNRNLQRSGSFKKRSRSDQPMKDELQTDKNIKVSIHKPKKVRPLFAKESPKISPQQISNEDKHMDRMTSKKLADIIDEVKEAKGEAVRGPSRFNSRLQTLAQPKKSYVQAHSEEYQNKYGRNLMADRLQRLATTTAVPSQNQEKPNSAGSKGRHRRNSTDATSTASVWQPPPSPPPLERGVKYRRSASSSPVGLVPPSDVPYNQNHSPAAHVPEILKNKMVAVESYVKSHYGRTPAPGSGHLHAALKARVPLVPHDLDLVSIPSSVTGEESTAIGSKLHRIINSMISSKPIVLAALTESRESVSRHSKETNYDDGDKDFPDNDLRDDRPSSVNSDYRVDIFEDQHVKTAVENFPRDEKQEGSITAEVSGRYDIECVKGTCQSTIELQKLKDALQRRISAGAFHNRLRIKNFTLTPKLSTQQVFLLQSGDVSSVLLKSVESKKIKLSSSQSNNTTNTKSLSSLANPQLDWNLSNIPMQITTVGYAFPTYNTSQSNSKKMKLLDDIFKPSTTTYISGNNVEGKANHPFTSMPQSKMQDMQISAASNNINHTLAEKDNEQQHQNKQKIGTPEVFDTGDQSNGTLQEISAAAKKSYSRVEVMKMEDDSENINCTSSLDILVGLLNEIQKITACHISNTENCTDVQECKELENKLLKNRSPGSVENNDSRELVSIASLDKLRQLESSASIYSLYISNDESESTNKIEIRQLFKNVIRCKTPCFVDKAVTVDFPERELITTFTDVPSKLFPVAMTSHGTNVTNSLLGILSMSSSSSSSSMDYETLYSDSSLSCQDKIVEMSQPIANAELYLTLSPKITDICLLNNTTPKTQNLKQMIVSMESNPPKTKSQFLTNCCIKASDVDPVLKMKRDILVTVYTMLVLTVFAALSIPEMLYYTCMFYAL